MSTLGHTPTAVPSPPAAATFPHDSLASRAAQVRFRRAMSLMAMTLVVPGLAQVVAGNRRLGTIVVRCYAALLVLGAAAVVASLADHRFAFWAATNTGLLLGLHLLLMALAVGWAALFVDAWRLGRPLSYGLGHRRVAIGVNGLLCLTVAGSLLFAAHLTGVQRGFILATFGAGEASDAAHGRYNVLLLGGDAGAGRWGLRPDSLTLASVDAETGRTVLIGLPRNMSHFPFREGSVMAEQFPDGFDCEDCMLNGVSTWAGDHPELFGDSEHPGVDATVMAVEGITGLSVNYFAMVNLDGFEQLVDAVGGVTLTVRDTIPIGLPGDPFESEIEPGRQRLDGFETLWYARARYGSDDYSRMARQKCVMNALLDQVSPRTALTNFESIAQASSDMVSTDLPASEVDRFLDLALKAKSQKISTVSLVPPLVETYDPDIETVRTAIQDALAKASGDGGTGDEKPRKRKRAAASESTTGGSIGSLSEGYAANEAEDLDSTC